MFTSMTIMILKPVNVCQQSAETSSGSAAEVPTIDRGWNVVDVVQGPLADGVILQE